MTDEAKDPLYLRPGVYAAGRCEGCEHGARVAAYIGAHTYRCKECGRTHEPAAVGGPDESDVEVSRLRARVAELEGRNRTLRELLESVEWLDSDEAAGGWCHWCGAPQSLGHEGDCALRFAFHG